MTLNPNRGKQLKQETGQRRFIFQMRQNPQKRDEELTWWVFGSTVLPLNPLYPNHKSHTLPGKRQRGNLIWTIQNFQGLFWNYQRFKKKVLLSSVCCYIQCSHACFVSIKLSSECQHALTPLRFLNAECSIFPYEGCKFVINPSLLLQLKIIAGFSRQPAEVQGQNKNASLPELSEVRLLILKHTHAPERFKLFSFFFLFWLTLLFHLTGPAFQPISQIWASINNCVVERLKQDAFML